MANSTVTVDSDYMRHAEYTPKSSVRSEADIDKRFGGTLIAVGLGVAAAGLAGRYAFQLWKPLGQVLSETMKKMPTSAFSAYYKGGFEQKMTKREASLILGISELTLIPGQRVLAVLDGGHSRLQRFAMATARGTRGLRVSCASPTSTKGKVREAHRRIMVLNHPDKGGSPYVAAKINEAKDLLDSSRR